MSTPRHLFVGVPSLSGQISSEVHRYMLGLSGCSIRGELPFTVEEGIVTGMSPVQYARNVLMGMALKSGADRVLLMDADMIPEPSVTRLLFSDADIASARMFRFRHHGEHGVEKGRPPEIAACATIVRGEERFDIVPNADVEGGPVKVDACGTGCIMIRRHVLEDPRIRVGPDDACEGIDYPIPALFRMEYTAAGRITEWEDIDFTLRASRLGYTVVVDFGARCGHRKSINLDAVAELYRKPDAATERMEAVAP